MEDVYTNDKMMDAVLEAAGCAFRAVEKVLTDGKGGSNAFAAIRPPGHHASAKKISGFCFVNNAVIAASYGQMVIIVYTPLDSSLIKYVQSSAQLTSFI